MQELLLRYPMLSSCEASIRGALDMMKETYKTGGTMLLCGNGGSCADCEHIVGELMKGFLSLRPMKEEDFSAFHAAFPDDAEAFRSTLQYGIPAISLPSLTAVSSAFINDVASDMLYAQLVYGFARKHDLVIGISTSGNSKNVINALKVAKVKGLKTLGLTGSKPCLMDDICDVVIKVPETETYKIQELHLPVYHYLCAALEAELF